MMERVDARIPGPAAAGGPSDEAGSTGLLGRVIEWRTDPFLHGWIDDFLPAAQYRELSASFVEPMGAEGADSYADGKRRLHFAAPPLPSALTGNSPWSRFVAQISSDASMKEMREAWLRASSLRPPEADYASLASRRREIPLDAFRLYCEFSTLPRGAWIRPHTDATFKFLSCVFYFGEDPWSQEWGGATELYRPANSRARFNWSNREIDMDDVLPAGRCEFRPNRLFVFLKGHDTLHGVAPVASPDGVSRRSFNFALEVPREVYCQSPAGIEDAAVQAAESRRLAPGLGRRWILRARRLLRAMR